MSRDALTVQVQVAALPERVWEMLAVDRAGWWPDLVFEPAVGAPLVESWLADGRRQTATGTVTRCEPPSRLVFVWREPSWSDDLAVDVEIIASGGRTTVSLTESGFVGAGSPPELLDAHEDGWRYHLARLRRVSEGRRA
ncbi:MAG: SRPBCC domain-containing protein [Microbacterium arborescens]